MRTYTVTSKNRNLIVEAEWYSLGDGVKFNRKSPVLRFYTGKRPNEELVAMFNNWDFVRVNK